MVKSANGDANYTSGIPPTKPKSKNGRRSSRRNSETYKRMRETIWICLPLQFCNKRRIICLFRTRCNPSRGLLYSDWRSRNTIFLNPPSPALYRRSSIFINVNIRLLLRRDDSFLPSCFLGLQLFAVALFFALRCNFYSEQLSFYFLRVLVFFILSISFKSDEN